ncbi:MAG: hypothetical protein IJQ90_00420 [Alphaproteobacteria bacterium]|nr:hypothetical protein [Alphaproteobacteria bacterium]
MKKYILFTIGSVSLAACQFDGISPEQCNDYVNSLTSSGDIIQVLDTYIEYRDWWKSSNDAKTQQSLQRSCWNDFLRRQDIDYTCLDKDNVSDECILYRRNNKYESEFNFYDFTKFLSQDSYIKNETDFKMALEYYEINIRKCEALIEKTSVEKEDCVNNIKDDLRNFSKHGMLLCRNSLKKEYRAMLKEQGQWYRWAINHDPYGFYKEWVAMTGISGYEAQVSMYQPVYSKSSAAERVKEEIESWGKEHLCKTTNYLTDLKTLGFYM